MIEVIKNEKNNKESFPYTVKLGENINYLTKRALKELREKINSILECN